MVPHPDGGHDLRRRAAQPRAEARGVGLAELGGRRDRRGALRQARARPRPEGRADRAVVLLQEVAAGAVSRTTSAREMVEEFIRRYGAGRGRGRARPWLAWREGAVRERFGSGRPRAVGAVPAGRRRAPGHGRRARADDPADGLDCSSPSRAAGLGQVDAARPPRAPRTSGIRAARHPRARRHARSPRVRALLLDPERHPGPPRKPS